MKNWIGHFKLLEKRIRDLDNEFLIWKENYIMNNLKIWIEIIIKMKIPSKLNLSHKPNMKKISWKCKSRR